ncbi:MAG: MotA/TolQ/ExbB proton channel family protein [Lentisphaerae bacterium]|nr:MotA/TolQ/ExbB proton channel family protein [Lentisphaerota bacterium]
MITLIQQGGIVMGLILAAGLLVLGVFLERFLHLHRARIKTEDFIRGVCNILTSQHIDEALSICEETPGPVARLMSAAIKHRDQEHHLMVQAMDSVALTEITRLERRLGILATVAQIAPLLGLLGTVLGMIQTAWVFMQQAPLVQAGDLAGGVWQALLATAAGLVVAIVSYIGYNWLVAKVEIIVLDMERAAGEISSFFMSAAAA